MDIFAHALWTGASARGANATFLEKRKRKFQIAWTAFWGIFPDLFAFGIPMLIAIPQILAQGLIYDRSSLLGLPHELYNYSHSLVLWALVFSIVWLVTKKLPLALFGWALHILIDIPSHVATFFPTPFLWPLSNYHFTHGISWANHWYMLINYSALLIVFGSMLIHDLGIRRIRKQQNDYLASK